MQRKKSGRIDEYGGPLNHMDTRGPHAKEPAQQMKYFVLKGQLGLTNTFLFC